MKINLLVLTAGTMQGKAIPITLTQFLIGRDRQCHLRPASPLVSNRHCALLVRSGKVYARDLGSTNGTFVNKQRLTGEVLLHDQDHLQVGPVAFQVRLEATPRVQKPAPVPVPRAPVEAVDDEAMAALLLALPEEGDSPSAVRGVDSEGVPTGSTVMNVPVPAALDELPDPAAETQKPAVPPTNYDTSAAAKSLLQKYRQQSRK
jgi:pSer/pThr/pTyr-binding forkhead associated (FHA) protein